LTLTPRQRKRVPPDELPGNKVNIKILPVRKIWFTQDSVRDRFRDGRTMEAMVAQLLSGKLNPLVHKSLLLTVVCVGDRYRSNDNRRLEALYQYQDIVDKEVCVRVKLTRPLDKTYDRFLARFTVGNSEEVKRPRIRRARLAAETPAR